MTLAKERETLLDIDDVAESSDVATSLDSFSMISLFHVSHPHHCENRGHALTFFKLALVNMMK